MRNKITLLGAALILSLFAAFGTQASAQAEYGQGFSARIGGFFPTDEDVRDATDDIWLTAGVDYQFYRFTNINPSNPNYSSSLLVSLDWYGVDEGHAIPLLINYQGRINQFFYQAGVGIAFIDGGDDDTDFAWQIGAGYDFSQGQTPLYGLLRYHGNGEDDLNGFSLALGVRF